MVKGITMDYDSSKKLSKKKRRAIFCGARMKDNCNNSVLNYSPHLGGYKQKIKTLSENNKNLVEALENYRYRCSEKDKMLIKVSTTVLQNTISAKIKLNKLADVLKEASSFVKEVTSIVNTTSSILPSMFDPNILSKIKNSHNDLNGLIESISEESVSNRDDFPNQPKISQEESEHLESNTSSSTSTKINGFKRKRAHLKQNKSEGRVSVSKFIQESKSRSQFRKQKILSDIQKPGSAEKQCTNITEVKSHNQFSIQQKKRTKFDNENTENQDTVNPMEVSLDKLQIEQNIVKIGTKQLQSSNDVSKKDEIETNLSNVSVDKHPETKMTTKQKGKLVQKRCKANRKTAKSTYEKQNASNESTHKNKAKNINGKVNSIFEEKDAKHNGICSDIEDARCSNEEEFPYKIVDKLSKKQVLHPPQNNFNDKTIQSVVEIHTPPSGEVARRKARSSNVAFDIMQPRVVLTDILKSGLESDRLEYFKDKTSTKVRSIKSKRKSSFTKGKVSKAKENISLNIRTSRPCRSHTVACYKEPSLNRKLRKS